METLVLLCAFPALRITLSYSTIYYNDHSALSFALFEIAVPNNHLFSLLRQKIDFFLKKMVKGKNFKSKKNYT